MPIINVANAQINTVEVAIKTLTLNGKQLTLSAFRQISNESILKIDGILFSLNGLPWGTVNYFFAEDKDKKDSHYMNIIWQKGSELRRSVIEKSFINTEIHDEIKSELRYLLEQYSCLTDIERKKYAGYSYDDYSKCNIHYLQSQIDHKNTDTQDWAKEQVIALTEKLTKSKSEAANYLREIAEQKKDMESARKSYELVVNPLFDLPQLFIAI